MSTGVTTAIDLLESSLNQTTAAIAGIGDDQRSLPTPCAGWDVHALVRHVVGQDLRNFLAGARAESADWQAPADELADDWAGLFRDGAQRLLAEWRAADLELEVPTMGGGVAPLGSRLDQQIAEFAMHSWDLVRATGQKEDLDPAVAEHSLDWSKKLLRPEYRGPNMAFGPEVPVDPEAPPYDRLAGWFGRDPSWRAASA